MKMTYSDTFNCSPQQLWPWITDDEKSKQWLEGLERVEPKSSGPKRPGYEMKSFIREGRKLSEYDMTVLAYEPNRLYQVKSVGGCGKGATFVCEYQLVDLQEGRTRVDFAWEIHTTSKLMKLFGPLFMLFGKKMLKRFLRKLRALAETRDGAVSAAH